MMRSKYALLITLVVNTLCCFAQYPVNQYYRMKQLLPVDKLDTLKEGYSIIYGSFIHRSRPANVGARYDEIRLSDTTTGETFAFAILPQKYIDRFYLMAFHIKPGV